MKFPALIVLFIFLGTEFYLFSLVSSQIGGGWTVLLVFVSAFLGVQVIRRLGFSVLSDMQADLAAGKQPVLSLMGNLLIFVGGVLLVMPGFFTDFIGIILLTKPGRRIFSGIAIALALPAVLSTFSSSRVYAQRFSTRQTARTRNDQDESNLNQKQGPVIIETDYRVEDDR
jgi:UPF0716 protein FxsA